MSDIFNKAVRVSREVIQPNLTDNLLELECVQKMSVADLKKIVSLAGAVSTCAIVEMLREK